MTLRLIAARFYNILAAFLLLAIYATLYAVLALSKLYTKYTPYYIAGTPISFIALTAFRLINFGVRIILLEAEDTRRGKKCCYT